MEQGQISGASVTGSMFVPSELSYEDFLRKYYGYKVEYVGSEVIGPMTVGVRHNQLTQFLTSVLRVFVEENGLGTVLGERFQMRLEFVDGIHGREPDVFFVRNENLDSLTENYFDGGADLAIEIISPESIVRDTQVKFEEYEAAGVKEYWLVDHFTRTANFYGLNAEGKYKLLPITSDGKFNSQVVDGLWIQTDWLWAEPLPTIRQVMKEWGLI